MLSPKQALPILLLSAVISNGGGLPSISPHTSAIAQETAPQEATAQIINIQLQPADTGLDLILETSNGDMIQPFVSEEENTLILDLVNAQLALPNAEDYSIENPAEEVSSLIVETLDTQSIRITIAGVETLPDIALSVTGEEFIVSLPGVSAIAREPDLTDSVETPAVATDIAEITHVRLQPISSGVELILETANGEMIQPFSTVEGETLILDLVNARLALPEGDRYSVENPIEEASSLIVETLDAESVRITIVGIETLPEANLSVTGEEFIIEVPSAAAIAQSSDASETADSGVLRIGVTGQEENYAVTEASTGTRSDAELRDIPQSVQVIPRRILEDRQVVGIEEALENVGGVSYLGNNDGRGLNFSIRGFGTFGSPILRDGFRLFGNDSVEPEVANIEQIEILKGPASVLYGQGDPGGLINIVSKQPLSEPYYNLQLQGGTREFFRPSMDLSGPLTEDGSVLYRLNVLYRHEDSFRDLDNSYDRFSIAPTLTWFLNDRTEIAFSLERIVDKDPIDFGTLAFGTGIADIPPERITTNPGDSNDKEYLNVGYSFEHRFSDNWKLRNQFRHISDRQDYGVLALPFVLDEDTGILTRVFAAQFNDVDINTLYTNIQGEFNTGSVKHNLLFGVDLSRSDNENATRFSPQADFFSFLDIFNPDYTADAEPAESDIPIAFGSNITTNRVGIYLQDRIDLLDNLILLAGARYDTVDRKTTNALTGAETEQYDDAITPRVGLVYQPSDEISLYASYAQSFNPSSSTDANGNPLEAETGEGFEFGVKAELLEDRLFATLAYFDITKQNVATTDPDNPFASIATGEQRSRGFDFDLSGEIVPGWNIIASYAYIDAKITQDNSIPVGNRLAGIAEHSASLWTTYEIQSGDLEGLGFGLGFTYVGERQGENSNTFQVDGYFLTNAAIFYGRDNWQFRLNANNLFDIDYIEAVGNGRARGIYPGTPLTVRASFSVAF
ncbi:MAG: TonB-dependent siderophore receptor [Cyanobacteria bacterium P01_E01_bin.42]